jgi:hypothetical protein
MPTTTIKPKSQCPAISISPCKSSQVHGYGYCPDTKTLAMQFKQKGNALSAVYQYPCPPELYAELEAAESKGKFFGQKIKPLDAIKVVEDEHIQQAAA